MIKIENLTYNYPNTTTPALNNINLEIKEGEFILLVGPSGCGKSTLVQCLNGIVPNVAGGDLRGKIKINEKNISNCKVHQLSRYVGMVFQNPNACISAFTALSSASYLAIFIPLPVNVMAAAACIAVTIINYLFLHILDLRGSLLSVRK